ncbi:hypothetical protein AAF712_013753 [Marasmius tenuissimus]|uniref:Uncharacterized protein n=1 Tax=Marasmius tenuissimus TaxID=585030 RepID=A0ABR2ZDV6_9AGAR
MRRILGDCLWRAKNVPLTIRLTVSDTYWSAGMVYPHEVLSILGDAPNLWRSVTVSVYAEPGSATHFLSHLSPLDNVRYLNLWVGRVSCMGFQESQIEDESLGIEWTDPESVWPLPQLCGSEERHVYRPLIPLLRYWPSPFHHLTRLDIAASDGAMISFLGCLKALRELHVLLVPAPDCEDMFGDTVEGRLNNSGGGNPEVVLHNLHSLSLRLTESRPGVANVLCMFGCPRLQRFAVALPQWQGHIGHLSKFYTLVAIGKFLEYSGGSIDSFGIFPPPEYLLMAPHVASPVLQAALEVPTSRGKVRGWLKEKMPVCRRWCWGEMEEDKHLYREIWDPYSWPEGWQEFFVDCFPPWRILTGQEL